MHARHLHFFCFAVGILLGCKKGVPDITQARILEGFDLDQAVIRVQSKTRPEFQISGQCLSHYEDFEVSIDSGVTWRKLQDVAPDLKVTCSTAGRFAAQVSFALQPLAAEKWNQVDSYNELVLRAWSARYGFSGAKRIRLDASLTPTYVSSQPSAAGSTRMSLSGGYTLNDRVQIHGAVLQTVQGYRLESAVAW